MKKIYVTRPSIPPLYEFIPFLEKIWKSKCLTNKGYYHDRFEEALAEYLNVKNVSLFCNGTIALLTGLKALNIKKEIITTPFTFVATSHAIKWNNCTPVFGDISLCNYNLNPNVIESLINQDTEAILPVHVYGVPCDVDAIEKIGRTHSLKIFYDAAHAFGVKIKNRSVLSHGDISMLSFHATKVFNTIEGGALITKDSALKQEIEDLKNFGIKNEETVAGIGINGKMNEVQAAYGLLQLQHADEYIRKSMELDCSYRKYLGPIPGLILPRDENALTGNSSYFPILVDAEQFGISRDGLYQKLKEFSIYTRKYFFPLVSNLCDYCHSKSASEKNLPVANFVSERILCLPIYPDLKDEELLFICNSIQKIHEMAMKNR